MDREAIGEQRRISLRRNCQVDLRRPVSGKRRYRVKGTNFLGRQEDGNEKKPGNESKRSRKRCAAPKYFVGGWKAFAPNDLVGVKSS